MWPLLFIIFASLPRKCPAPSKMSSWPGQHNETSKQPPARGKASLIAFTIQFLLAVFNSHKIATPIKADILFLSF